MKKLLCIALLLLMLPAFGACGANNDTGNDNNNDDNSSGDNVYSGQSDGVINAPVVTELNGLPLTFHDEFDGDKLNTEVWNYEYGYNLYNEEHQFYQEENLTLSNGVMTIQPRIEDGKITSSRINTDGKVTFGEGIIEARMKLPDFLGSWPAFWLLGTDHRQNYWPKCGEIDIMEAINTEKKIYCNTHWDNQGHKSNGGNIGINQLKDFDRTEFHTYGLIKTQTQLSLYLDSVENIYFTADISDSELHALRGDYFIILNLAVGGVWPGHEIDEEELVKQSMQVDYVRIYSMQ